MLRDIYIQNFKAIQEDAVRKGRTLAAELQNRIETGEAACRDYITLATELESLLEFDEALVWLKKGLDRCDSVEFHIRYINALARRNQTSLAIDAARAAIARFPDNAYLQFREALMLPILYDTAGEIEYYRARFIAGLEALENKLSSWGRAQLNSAASGLERSANFFLAYQMKNDKELQQRYSRLVRRILTTRYPELGSAPTLVQRSGSQTKIKVGYLSAYLGFHSVSSLFAGWILGQDRDRFEIFVYQIGGNPEEVRDDIRFSDVHFRHLAGELPHLRSIVIEDRLDAAIFLDVGMHPVTAMLASLRLAPVQCATWGHPVTTGSPSMDYFLTSDLMEPGDAEAHYSERLVRLPGVGVDYRKPFVPRAILEGARTRFGLDPAHKVYLCGQSTFKYVPQHDDVFPAIALKVRSSRFVFIGLNPAVGQALRSRLERAFAEKGLVADEYCVVLPKLHPWEYWALNLASDVYLDSLEWSGFNTTLEAIACRLPVVTLPGSLMRGRHSFAALKQLGAAETIADSKEGYVDIAARLALDKDWRSEIIHKMAAGESNLFEDKSSTRFLDEFLSRTVRSATIWPAG